MLKKQFFSLPTYWIAILIFLAVPLFYFLFTDIDVFLPLITLGVTAFPIGFSILKRRDILSPINIFCFLYGISFGAVPFLQQFDWIALDPAYARHSPLFGRMAHFLGLAGIIFIFLGYYEGKIARAFCKILPTLKRDVNFRRLKTFIIIPFFISGVAFFLFIQFYEIKVSNFTEYFIYTNISAFGRGHLAFFASFYLFAGFIALMGIFNPQIKRRRFFIAAFFLAVFLAFLSRSRGQVLLLIFLFLVFYNYKVKKLHLIKITSIFVLILLLIFLIAQFRGSLSFQATKQNIANTFAGLFAEHQATATLLSEYYKEDTSHFYGKIFIEDTILSLIPRRIWPTKPEQYGSIFITNIIIPNRQPGFFYTIGPFGTAYADFGYMGIFIVMLFFGFVMRVVYDYFKKNKEHSGMLLWYGIFCFNLWAFMRGGWGFMPIILENTIIVVILYSLITNRFILKSAIVKKNKCDIIM